ncbi:KH domain-containing, RNA-binding, signal transduction-associated protein 1-like [Chiloscyllium plagiosum]|uniref:KH domain-containing, RNA-binding, signal transduction-associated protein 1-like n=1 Tax=Chiloscyllium plagiosum TaxID=36176 RepID=UPI001CB7ED0D|nr:KH domain-containing, RNA-binding, signal transduction-associated protein 1-like [Chiloscyllium plagiosum]
MANEKYLPELMAEKDSLDPSFVHASRLLAAEIEKVQKGEKKEEEKRFLDVLTQKSIKLSERCLIPVAQFPKFNFVGKLLGPRGNSLKRLQEDTGTKMSILGKGSMRDKSKDYNDEIRQEQLTELAYLNGGQEASRGRGVRGRGALPVPLTRGRGAAPPLSTSQYGPRGAITRGAAVRGAPGGRREVASGRGATPVQRGAPAPRTRGAPAAYRPALHPPPAQESYDEYGYDDGYAEQSYDSYENYYDQAQGDAEYFDYGHGEVQETYEDYGQEDWSTGRASLKAPARSLKGMYRDHPYGRY